MVHNENKILDFIADFLEDGLAKTIRNNPDVWEVEYLDYDWSLNE